MNFQELTERLMKHRRLLVRGKITSEMEDVLATAFLLLDLESSQPIRLDIDSGGGEANPARYLGDVIGSLRSPVCGVVVGYAGSAAFTLLQTCDLRIGLPNSRFMFHPVSSEVRVDQPDSSLRLAHGKHLHEQNLKELAERSGQPLNKLRRWSRMERVFRATEALELGFIDKIEYPNKPKVK